jgi:ABC-type antimicrobial peptide transport system permease subunit
VMLLATLMAAFWAAFGMSGIVSGSLNQVEQDLRRLGWDLIHVHAHPDPLRFLRHGLTVARCERLAEMVSGRSAPVSFQPAVAYGHPAGGKGEAEEVILLLGTTPIWRDVERPEFLAGRFFRDDEKSVCVIDQWVERRLFAGREPTSLSGDETIDVQWGGSRQSFRVVGVIADPIKIRERFEDVDTTGASRSNLIRLMEFKNVYVPRSAIASGDSVLAAVIRVGEGVDPQEGARRIQEELTRSGSTAVAWSSREWARRFLDAGLTNISMVTHFIWTVVLVVTAFMVVTVTFIIVRQRFGEIAVRRVEGASIGQITWQLIFENLFLTLLAESLGLILAWFSNLWVEHRYLGWPVPVSAGDIVFVGTAGILIMVLTTVLPARRAASIDPVHVLRER